jgi:hypothetical protein
MKTRNSLSPGTVLVLASAFLAGVVGVTFTAGTMPASTKGGGNAAGGPDVMKIPAPPAPPVPMPFPTAGDVSSGKRTASGVKFEKNKALKAQDVPKLASQMEEELAAVGEALQAWKAVSHKLNEEQRARLEATIKMHEDVKATLVPLVTLRARLQVDLGVMQQLSEDVPKVTAALDKALGFVLEKLEEAAKRRDKGEDAGLPERVANTILENVLEAFGNLKKDTEKVLNDAKKTPKHYREEFRRLNEKLAAACAAFEESASQAAAFHASNLEAVKGLAIERGKAREEVKKTVSKVKAHGSNVTRHLTMYGMNGSNPNMPLQENAQKVRQSAVRVAP